MYNYRLIITFMISMILSPLVIANDDLSKKITDFSVKIETVTDAYQKAQLTYIHKGYGDSFDDLAVNFINLNQQIEKLEASDENSILSFKFSSFFLIHLGLNYQVVRYFNEGSYEDLYPANFFESLRERTIKLGKDLQKKGFELDSELKVLRAMKKYKDTWYDEVGNEIVDTVVDGLGRICKRRLLAPSLNFKSNFRQNYLYKYQDRTLETLLAPGGMQIGDIILEKDQKANSDALIPGYWTHASIYLGTIEEFKYYKIWDHPTFAPIRKSIENYQTDNEKIKFLKKKVKKLRENFEKITWYIESGRKGVEVYPMRFFLGTDGMAVLRPFLNAQNEPWTTQDGAQIALASTRYLGLAYDFNHNNNSKFKMNCTEFVLRVFDFLTFPTSKNLRYDTIMPDQIGKSVTTDLGQSGIDPTIPLQLIQFYDVEFKGSMTFNVTDKSTHSHYREYLKANGLFGVE